MSRGVLAKAIPALLGLISAGVIIKTVTGDSAGNGFPDPVVNIGKQTERGKAFFAGGCFWCLEAVFEQLSGVEAVACGYAGGKPQDARYELVHTGQTDHAEAIEVTYDPSKISYGQLLKVFFSVAHDPTQLNRQGPDFGRQFRSAIFYVDAHQKRAAEAYISQLEKAKVYPKPIVTDVVELKGFYPAEDYNQDFVKKNPDHPYVLMHAMPKVKKLRKQFPSLLKH